MLRRAAFVMLLLSLGLSACNQANQPYVSFAGGGFIFNYRLAYAYAGVVLGVRRTLPDKSVIEVTMENPAGGAPIVMRQTPGPAKRIEFETDALSGIVAKKDYKVTIRLLTPDGAVLQTIDRTYQSDLDQSVLPPVPLTVGPGYAPNPALSKP